MQALTPLSTITNLLNQPTTTATGSQLTSGCIYDASNQSAFFEPKAKTPKSRKSSKKIAEQKTSSAAMLDLSSNIA